MGQGGHAPTINPFRPPRQFSKLSKSRRSVKENAIVFSHMAILTSKVCTSDHLSHVLISIFIVFLLRTDRIVCVFVCVCVCVCVWYHTSVAYIIICKIFLYVAYP